MRIICESRRKSRSTRDPTALSIAHSSPLCEMTRLTHDFVNLAVRIDIFLAGALANVRLS